MPSILPYRYVPWFLKVPAKIVLARLPLPHSAWNRLGLFRHGRMADVEYAYRVFRQHFDASGIADRGTPFTMLELGPGDSVLSALFAYAHGACRSVLVDVSPCADPNAGVYVRAARMLEHRGRMPPDLEGVAGLNSVLARCRADYLTGGLNSLKGLPDASIDFAWSHAVLEHVRRDEFAETVHELHRILKPDGVASHQVDLRDHLGGKLNNLRFNDARWESPLFARSGFYTNRIRFGEMMELFEEAGFAAELGQVHRWDALPTPRRSLDETFRAIPDSDLRVRGFDVILRRRPESVQQAA